MKNQYYSYIAQQDEKIIVYISEQLDEENFIAEIIETTIKYKPVEGDKIRFPLRWINEYCTFITKPEEIEYLNKKRLLLGIV